MNVYRDYRIFHDIFVYLDEGDREVLHSFNLTPLQYHTLQLLDLHKGWRLTDLSDRLLVERSTITRLVDFLEREGLISRVADMGDRRSQRVILTPGGASLRERTLEAHEASLQQRFACLSEIEQQQLYQLHQKLLKGLIADREQNDDTDNHTAL